MSIYITRVTECAEPGRTPGRSPVVTYDWKVREQRLRPYFFPPTLEHPPIPGPRNTAARTPEPTSYTRAQGAGSRLGSLPGGVGTVLCRMNE